MTSHASHGHGRAVAAVRTTAVVVAVAVSAALTSWLVGRGFAAVSGDQQVLWLLGRAGGICAYLLMVTLVVLGLLLSHPWRARVRWPGPVARVRLHVSVAVFTLAFVVLHVFVLATDSYAGVGVRGVFVPLGASYRPMPVTLGVIGLWSGLLAGLTAAFAGRLAGRVWWPIHKVAIGSLVLVWGHSVLAGSDTRPLLALYLVTGAGVLALAVSRYLARTPADRVAELVVAERAVPRIGAVR